MAVHQEMTVIQPLVKNLVMAEDLEFQEVGELMDHLIGIPEIMNPQGMGDIHQDEDHQEEEEDLLVPLEIQGHQEIKGPQDPLDREDTEDLQDPKDLWDHRDHLDKVLGHPIYQDPLLYHR